MKSIFKSKKVLNSISILMIILFTTGILSACGPQENPAGNTEQSSAQAVQSTASHTEAVGSAETSAAKYPLTIKDSAGTPVTISDRPVKIVSLPLGISEMLLSIVDKSSIAALTNYVDDPAVSNVTELAKGVGQRLDSNAEKVIALQPDLVLVDSWAQAEFIKQLRDAKLTVFVMNLPSNVDEQKEALKLLGNITDSSSKAGEVISWMDEKLKAVSDKLAGVKEEDRLTILDYSEMGSTSGKGTNFDDVVSRAGLINPVSRDGIEGWPELSKEMIVKYNPDIINLPSWYYDSTKASFESLSKLIKGDKALAGVKAVKNGKIISVPYNHLSSPSQYSVLAIEDMAKAAYPDLFK